MPFKTIQSSNIWKLQQFGLVARWSHNFSIDCKTLEFSIHSSLMQEIKFKTEMLMATRAILSS